MPSITAAISLAVVRFFVPLKAMCSKKWLIPLDFGGSFLAPDPTQTDTVADSIDDMGTVKTLSLFASLTALYFTFCILQLISKY